MEATIKRGGVELYDVPDEVSEESKVLAGRVAKELGYYVATTSVQERAKERATKTKVNQVIEALRSIDIEIFSGKSIGDYKEKMLKKVNLEQRKKQTGVTFTWFQYKLESYVLPVPEFALARALQIKDLMEEQKLGTPSFFVDQLQENRTRAVDPFLYFTMPGCDSHVFYVEVWDEPVFEGVRQV